MVASSRFFFQLKRRRAVVGQQLARELGVDRVGELLGERQVGRAGLAPDQVGVLGVGQAAADGLVEAVAWCGRSLRPCARRCRKGLSLSSTSLVTRSAASASVRASSDGRHAHHVGGQARGDQLGDGFARRHQHLAAHVAALLDRGELVFEVHAGGAGFDHGLHQLEGVQHAAEAGFGIGHDRREVVDVALVAGLLPSLHWIWSARREGVVDLLDDLRHRVHRVQRLVGVHLAVAVGVAGDLPARQVDRLQAGLDLLHGLVAGQRAERS